MELKQVSFSQYQDLRASYNIGPNKTMFPTIKFDVELYNLKRAYDVSLEAEDCEEEQEEDDWDDSCHPLDFCESQINEEEDVLGSSKSSYKCSFCSYTGTICQLQAHMKCNHHEMPNTEHWCELCELNFENDTAFKRHRIQEHFFHCTHCNRKFRHHRQLLAHLPVHNGESKTSYSCPTCNKVFLAQRYFIRHLKRHEKKLQVKQENEEQIFKCTKCDKGFPKKESMMKHVKIHSRESLKCSSCEFTCENRVTLKMHLISHEGTRKYKCKHCDYSFKQIGHLKRHIVRFKH